MQCDALILAMPRLVLDDIQRVIDIYHPNEDVKSAFAVVTLALQKLIINPSTSAQGSSSCGHANSIWHKRAMLVPAVAHRPSDYRLLQQIKLVPLSIASET